MTKKDLKELFRQNKMSGVWNMLEPKLKHAITMDLERVEEHQLGLGQSKLGGLPDLPKGQRWPMYKGGAMSFVGQINLEEIAEYDLDKRLPERGMLYFFYDAAQEAWGTEPSDKEASRVIFYEGELDGLETVAAPEDLEDEAIFWPARITFASKINMPDYESDLLYDVDLADEEYELYSQLDEMISDEEYLNKILGHANSVQSGMELECELVRNGLSGDSSGFKSPKAKALKRHIESWHLLLQVDSNDETCNMLWGEAGRLFFWIREEDLRQRNFDAAWLILQSY